jgi:FdrA protein
MAKSVNETLLNVLIKVINVGLESFARELTQNGVATVHVDWTPPAGGDPKLADLLAKLGI